MALLPLARQAYCGPIHWARTAASFQGQRANEGNVVGENGHDDECCWMAYRQLRTNHTLPWNLERRVDDAIQWVTETTCPEMSSRIHFW